jgi:hypothetical protein
MDANGYIALFVNQNPVNFGKSGFEVVEIRPTKVLYASRKAAEATGRHRASAWMQGSLLVATRS